MSQSFQFRVMFAFSPSLKLDRADAFERCRTIMAKMQEVFLEINAQGGRFESMDLIDCSQDAPPNREGF